MLVLVGMSFYALVSEFMCLESFVELSCMRTQLYSLQFCDFKPQKQASQVGWAAENIIDALKSKWWKMIELSFVLHLGTSFL